MRTGWVWYSTSAGSALGHEQTWFYARYHHHLLHGWFGAPLQHGWYWPASPGQRQRAAVLCLIGFICTCCVIWSVRAGRPRWSLADLLFRSVQQKDPMWLWKGQWPHDAWPNRLLSACCFSGALGGVRRGDSFVGHVLSPFESQRP